MLLSDTEAFGVDLVADLLEEGEDDAVDEVARLERKREPVELPFTPAESNFRRAPSSVLTSSAA